jgi:hypothetical protein
MPKLFSIDMSSIMEPWKKRPNTMDKNNKAKDRCTPPITIIKSRAIMTTAAICSKFIAGFLS